MKFHIPQLPFWSILLVQIITFIFLIFPGLLNLPLFIPPLFIISQFIVIGLGFFHLSLNKDTKKYFYISWELQIFLFIFVLLLFQPEEVLAVETVSFTSIVTLLSFLIIFELFFLTYAIFKERAIKKILFSLAFSTTIIVFLIVFFVMSEGLPAFQENDPIDLISGSKFTAYYRIDLPQTTTVETTINPSSFMVSTTKEKNYISPNTTYNTSIKITNLKQQPQNFSIEIITNATQINTNLIKNHLSLHHQQTGTINLTVNTTEKGTYSIQAVVTSNLSNSTQYINIVYIAATNGISLTPNNEVIKLKKGQQTQQIPGYRDGIPLFFTHLGSTNQTYTIKFESDNALKPYIEPLQIGWDPQQEINVTLPPYQTFRFFLHPNFIKTTTEEKQYYLNVSISSVDNTNIVENATFVIDYTHNELLDIVKNKKEITYTDEAFYLLNFSDVVEGNEINITITTIQGKSKTKLIYNNQTILNGDGKKSIFFNETTGNVVTLIIEPKRDTVSPIITEIHAVIPGTEPSFGMLPFIVGTIFTTLVAIFIAAPIGIAIAILLAEFIPNRIRKILRPLYELLAGIPSVIYGLWGFITLGPLLREYIYPHIANTLGKFIPLFESSTSMGRGIFTASIVLSIMILPIIITLSEDSIRSVSKSLKEGSLAMGATRWQTMKNIILPQAKSGIVSSVILGTGRAIGETMAVLMIMGVSINLPTSIFDHGITMTGIIASTFQGVFVLEKSRHALFAIGIILFIMVFTLNLMITYITKGKKSSKKLNFIKKIIPLHNSSNEKKTENRNKIDEKQKKFSIINEKTKQNQNEKKFIILNNENVSNNLKKKDTSIIKKELTNSTKSNKDSFVKTILGSTKKALRQQKIVQIQLIAAAIIASFFLFFILGDVIINGGLSVRPEFFFEVEKDAGRAGGYLNAIIGSLYLVAMALAVAAPLSIGAALYVEEYAKKNSIITRVIMFTSDTLASTPSIIFGAFGFMLFVLYLDFGYSVFAGGMTLAFMIIPLMLRSSIEAIKAIPRDFQEGSLALGATKWQSISTILLPAALPGIISGVIISLGRAIGETAAVLLTAGYATQLPQSPLHSAASMPNLIYKNYSQAGLIPILGDKVYSAAFVLITIVLILNLIARLFSIRGAKMMKG